MIPDEHVMPLKDLHPHNSGMECPCKPVVQPDGVTVIHNAWDGREAYEMVTGELFRGRKWIRVAV